MTNFTVEQLVNIGGNEWTGGTHHRVYFNDLRELFSELKVHFYGTGNVSSATLNGQHISNTKARKMLTDLDIGKLYYDVNKGEFLHENMSEEIADKVINQIKKLALHG